MTDQAINLRIRDIVDSPIWVSTVDGEKIYRELSKALDAGRRINLSFAGCDDLLPPFIHVAVGPLYNGKYPSGFVDEHLTYTDLTPDNRETVEMSIEGSKKYHADKEGWDRAWKEVMDEYE